MGYNTDFMGELKFTQDIKGNQLAALDQILGEDCREHPEWVPLSNNLTWINLEVLDDYTGIKWSGDEKSYDMVEKVNMIIGQMQKTWPEFGLTGSMLAQGEDMNDRWMLVMENGVAVQKDIIEIVVPVSVAPVWRKIDKGDLCKEEIVAIDDKPGVIHSGISLGYLDIYQDNIVVEDFDGGYSGATHYIPVSDLLALAKEE